MLERDGYVQGVPCWVDTSQPDPEAAVEFYRGTFGLELVHEEINEGQGVREGMLRAPGDQ